MTMKSGVAISLQNCIYTIYNEVSVSFGQLDMLRPFFVVFRFIQAENSMVRPTLNYFTTAFIKISLPTEINDCLSAFYEILLYNFSYLITSP